MSENKFILLRDKYLEELSHLANQTRKGHRTSINSLGKFINFKNSFDPSDILDYLNSEYFNNLEIATQNTYRARIARFCLWIGFRKKEIATLYNKKKDIQKTLKKSDLLTKEEIRLILSNMNRPIDKALFMLLLETKARKSEIRKLKIKDVVFYESYAMVYIRSSKTAQRNIPIVESIPYLTRYLEDHPLIDDPEAPFFITLYSGKFKEYSENAFNRIFKKCTKDMKKRVYPHLLRHTGLTEMAKHLTEFQLKQLAGWTMDSKQAARYVHLSNQDLENKILELHGIKPPEIEEEVKHIEIVRCPRCDFANSELDKYCSRCGSVLDIKTIIQHQEKAKELEEIINASEIKQYIDNLFEEKVFNILDKKKD